MTSQTKIDPWEEILHRIIILTPIDCGLPLSAILFILTARLFCTHENKPLPCASHDFSLIKIAAVIWVAFQSSLLSPKYVKRRPGEWNVHTRARDAHNNRVLSVPHYGYVAVACCQSLRTRVVHASVSFSSSLSLATPVRGGSI